MERELLFALLAGVAFGTTAWTLALARRAVCTATWTSLVTPSFVGVLAIAFCSGWAIQESDPADESASLWLAGAALVWWFVGARAGWRAVRSLRRAAHAWAPIATVGILRPSVRVSPEFARGLDPAVLVAALLHEAAHARARDPLRIWVAQLAVDLCWPIVPPDRIQDWLAALELSTDDDAVAAGACPRALAEAIVAAARWSRASVPVAVAPAHGHGACLEARVRRLLAAPVPARRAREGGLVAGSFFACMAITGALALGVVVGEDVVRRIPGVRPASD